MPILTLSSLKSVLGLDPPTCTQIQTSCTGVAIWHLGPSHTKC